MNKKRFFLILSCAITLSGCNGLAVLLNPPTVTGYPSRTGAQPIGPAPVGKTKNGSRTVLQKAPDLSQRVSP